MPSAMDEFREYLDFHYLWRILSPFERYGLLIDYTVTSHESSQNDMIPGTESELDHLFIRNNTSETYRLIIMIREEWFDRCVQSRNNHQKRVGLNEEFNQFMLKILDGIAELNLNNINEIGTDSTSSNIPALNSPPIPSPPSEITLKIETTINSLNENNGPDYGDNCWIWPDRTISFG